MSTNFHSRGETVTLTAPTGGIKSSEAFMSGSLFAVAQYDADEGDPVEGTLIGVWSLPKEPTTAAFSAGDLVFWDASTGECDTTATGFFPIGAAIADAGATDASVLVSLTAAPGRQSPRPNRPQQKDLNHEHKFQAARRYSNACRAREREIRRGFPRRVDFAVAAYDALQAETVEGHTVGVWSLPKAGTPLAFAEGAKVFWDNSAKTCKATSAGFYCIGAAVAAAGANDTHVLVRLDGRAVHRGVIRATLTRSG